jgi:hypothetical protein
MESAILSRIEASPERLEQLQTTRAEAIRKYLIEEAGVAEDRITVASAAEISAPPEAEETPIAWLAVY